MFVYIHLHAVKILDIRVIAISCSSEHFAKVQFATISITFVKATGQSNKLLRLASCVFVVSLLLLLLFCVRYNIILVKRVLGFSIGVC